MVHYGLRESSEWKVVIIIIYYYYHYLLLLLLLFFLLWELSVVFFLSQ